MIRSPVRICGTDRGIAPDRAGARSSRQAGIVALTIAVVLAGQAHAQAPAPEAARGHDLFGERCALCHSASDAGGRQGPGLAGVFGRRAGAAAFGYSRALRSAGYSWDAAHLDRFLADPGAAAPGTTMPLKVPDPGERRVLIAYLATLPPPNAARPDAPKPASTPDVAAPAPAAEALLSGHDALGDWRADVPGLRRRLTAADLPEPFATRSSGNSPRVVDAPSGAKPRVPAGFRVELFADGLDGPRLMRVAPNGDVFISETAAGRVRILRSAAGASHAEQTEVFASGLDAPFGIAFYPAGPDPRWVYVAETNRVLRFPYRPGDLRASGSYEVVVARIAPTRGGHTTRDLAVSPDGTRLFVSVGSGSNVADGVSRRSSAEAAAFDATHGLGATWGNEEGRADVISVTPDGGDRRVVATGLRNCVGLAVHPTTGDLWCSTNERDGLGDDLVPDYVTRVREGAFYGWPWFYVGDREEPRLKGFRAELKGRMTEPDVLLQPHSAPLAMTFYEGPNFPASFGGDAFVALHGSWNRTHRTGYKVVRVSQKDGVPTGEYSDFLTGFVLDDQRVWGRPVGVAVARDGALLVSEDGNGTVWRVSYEAPK